MQPKIYEWHTALQVLLPKLRCPHCGADDYRSIRSMPTQTDGSKERRLVCNACEEPFIEVRDPDEVQFVVDPLP